MKIDKALSILAVIISTVAVTLSLRILHNDPLGTDISKYDLSNPEATLASVREMANKEDLRAAWQYIKSSILNGENSSSSHLIFGSPTEVKFAKSIEVTESKHESNNGLVISFVKYKVDGIEHHDVLYFKKNKDGKFVMDGYFYTPFDEKEMSEQDKLIGSSIEKFKKTGEI